MEHLRTSDLKLHKAHASGGALKELEDLQAKLMENHTAATAGGNAASIKKIEIALNHVKEAKEKLSGKAAITSSQNTAATARDEVITAKAKPVNTGIAGKPLTARETAQIESYNRVPGVTIQRGKKFSNYLGPNSQVEASKLNKAGLFALVDLKNSPATA